MTLWIDGRPFNSKDFRGLQKLIPQRPDLEDVVSFLKFWYSDVESWVVQTSGSTGIPKSVPILRAQMISSARLSLFHFGFSSKADAFLLCISTRFVGGFMVLVRAFLSGLDVWVEPPSSKPMKKMPPLALERNWFLSVAPLQLDYLSKQPQIRAASRNWKGILVGGASLSKSQLDSAQLFACPVYHTYGMTETVSHIAVSQVNGSTTESGSVFQVLNGIQIRQNENQCLEVRGEPTQNQWVTTRDRVEFLSEGRFRVLGRLDRVINSGGLKVDPDWIKEKLLELKPNIGFPFEIIGIPDEILGQKVILVFEKTDSDYLPVDWQNLFQNLDNSIDPRLIPKEIIGVPEIPMLENYKVNFPELERLVKLNING
ncbi:MAG TPA: AMP-binding protein [Catalimonadaceae bacterium]|nr:AMP-binding protein [Catalimonadaceae bacterium]